MHSRPRQPNQSIERGIKCLLELTSAEGPVSCKGMAQRLGVERTRAARILGTLAHLGMAERLPDLRYVPGNGIHVLSALSLRRSHLLQAMLPHFEALRARWGLDSVLGVLWNRHVCYLYHGLRQRELPQALAGSVAVPAEESSLGLVLLSHLPASELAGLMKGHLDRKALTELKSRLRAVRQNKHVHEEAQRFTAPLGDPPFAAVAVSGEMKGRVRQRILAHLLEVNRAVAEQLDERKQS